MECTCPCVTTEWRHMGNGNDRRLFKWRTQNEIKIDFGSLTRSHKIKDFAISVSIKSSLAREQAVK